MSAEAVNSVTLFRNARVLTLTGNGAANGPRRGAEAMNDLGVLPSADVLVEGGVIATVSATPLPTPAGARVIEAQGRVLCPAFVDCHTHACWAGDRLSEWELKLRGATYLEILESGGGIMSTVRSVRHASQASLAADLLDRLHAFAELGTLTVEVKSGYGLSTEAELKMLRAITDAAQFWDGTVVPTAMLGHAYDPAHPGFAEYTVHDTLPAVHTEFPHIAVDAFCEKGSWSVDETRALLRAARRLGHPARVHADQFNRLGMVEEAIALGALSVDHLEASQESELRRLAGSETFAVVLPCTGLHLSNSRGGGYANARMLVDLGAKLAIATNCNPGSSPTQSMPLTIGAAVRFCGLTPAEAITAATLNAASLLGFNDRGRIAVGCRADLLLLKHRDERLIAYELGGNPVVYAFAAGKPIARPDGPDAKTRANHG